jgi:outer membrane immunogenic protein
MRKKLLCGAAMIAMIASGALPGMAADLPVKARPAPAYAPAPDWSGFYLGGTVGYGWSKFSGDESGFGALQTKPKGGLVGIHGGYNWQVSQWVFGVEADMSGTYGNGWSKTVYTCPNCFASGLHGEVNGLASIRGRLGFAFDKTLIYATGGGAWAHYKAGAGASGILIQSGTVSGGVIGGGIEWKYNPNLSFRLEGLHYMFNKSHGPTSSDAGTGSSKIGNISVIRVGASYHFGAGGR